MTETYAALIVVALIILSPFVACFIFVIRERKKTEKNSKETTLRHTPETWSNLFLKMLLSYEKALISINNVSPNSYLLSNNYCKYDMLLFAAFYAKLFSPAEDGLHGFFEDELNIISGYATERLDIPNDKADGILHNRIQHFTEIVNSCDDDEKALENLFYAVTQFLKEDNNQISSSSDNSASPFVLGGFTKEFMITVQVRSFSKIFLQNYMSL